MFPRAWPLQPKRVSVTMRPAGSSHPDRTLLIASCAAVLAAWLVPAAAQDFPADVNRGKTVYQRHCLSCHGTGGWGDGPAAEALRVPPTNFHRFSSVIKTDEELLRTIEHGVVFSPMHSWQGRLTGSERAGCPRLYPSLDATGSIERGQDVECPSSFLMDPLHPNSALLVVDVQQDFLPGGALPVPQGGGCDSRPAPVLRTISCAKGEYYRHARLASCSSLFFSRAGRTMAAPLHRTSARCAVS